VRGVLVDVAGKQRGSVMLELVRIASLHRRKAGGGDRILVALVVGIIAPPGQARRWRSGARCSAAVVNLAVAQLSGGKSSGGIARHGAAQRWLIWPCRSGAVTCSGGGVFVAIFVAFGGVPRGLATTGWASSGVAHPGRHHRVGVVNLCFDETPPSTVSFRMTWRDGWKCLLLLALSLPFSFAHAREPLRHYFGDDYVSEVGLENSNSPPASHTLRHSVKSTPVPYLRNPGFEDKDAFGEMEHWWRFREGIRDGGNPPARSGQSSVRASLTHGWAQDLLCPVSPFQSFTIVGWANREFSEERAAIRASFLDSDGNFSKEEFALSPVGSAAGEYGSFWLTLQAPPSAAQLSLFLGGAARESWIRFDDVVLVTEQFAWSGDPTGLPWELGEGALTAGSDIVLPPNSTAAQLVSAGTQGEQYFVWGRYTADAATTFSVSETWLGRSTNENSGSTRTLVSTLAGAGTFQADPGSPLPESTGKAQVEIAAGPGGQLSFQKLRRGFAKVEPSIITAGPASPDLDLVLTAALPRHLTSATIEILNEDGDLVATPPPILHGTSIRAAWTPDGITSGPCTARFHLEAADGELVTVNRPFTIYLEPDATAAIATYKRPTFTRGAFLLFNFSSNAAYIHQAFQLAQQDGFNFAFVICLGHQFATVRAAAESVGLPFVIYTPPGISALQEYVGRSWFSKAAYLAGMKSLFEAVRESPLFQGPYISDEPGQEKQFELVRRASVSIQQDGTLGTAFAVNRDDASLPYIAAAEAPLGIVYSYPFTNEENSTATDALLDRIPAMSAHVKNFAATGRDCWIFQQGFEASGRDHPYPVRNSLHTAQLGAALLAGARGITPFTYNAPDDDADSLRRSDLVETRKLSAYRKFNTLIDRIGPLVMSLAVPEVRAGVPFPFAVSTTNAPGGGKYHYVLNADEETTRTLFLSLSAPVPPPQDVGSETPLPLDVSGRVVVTLVPGGWALFSTGSSNITEIDAADVMVAIDSTLHLPITHQFAVAIPGGRPLQVLGLDWTSDAQTLAISPGVFSFEVTTPTVYNLGPAGSVSAAIGPLRFAHERAEMVEGDHIAFSTSFLGTRVFAPGDFSTPVSEFVGFTGGASSLTGGIISPWISMNWWGARRLTNAGGVLTSAESGSAIRGAYTDLFGPFADSSVTVVAHDDGLQNLKPGQLFPPHSVALLKASTAGGDMNSQRVVALPRNQRGVGLFQLSVNGEPQVLGQIATEALDATGCAWLFDRVLAVGDGSRNVRFYRVVGTEATLLGTWRPEVPGPLYIRSVAARGNRLALGLNDGRVIVADISSLEPAPTAAADWHLLN